MSEQTVVNSSTIVGCNLLEGSVMPYCEKRLDFELERERSNRALWLTKSNGSCWNGWRNKKSLYENSKLPKLTMFRYDWLFIFFVTDNYCSFFFFHLFLYATEAFWRYLLVKPMLFASMWLFAFGNYSNVYSFNYYSWRIVFLRSIYP